MKKIGLIVIALIVMNNGYSQSKAVIPAGIDSALNQKKQKPIYSGLLKLNWESNIPVKTQIPSNPPADSVKVDSAKVDIVDGVIRNLTVFARVNKLKSKVYKNKSSIPLLNFDKRRGDKLFDKEYFIQQNKEHIIVNDVLDYYSEKNYLPGNDLLTLKSEAMKDSKNLSLSPNFNYLFNLVLYSDMLSLFDNQPNGLVQTEGSLRIIINTISIKGFTFLKYVQPYLSVSKFDSKNSYASPKFSDSTINQLDIFRKSWFNWGINVNLFSTWIIPKSPNSFEFNVGYRGSISRIVNLSKDSVACNINTWFFTPSFEFKVYDNLGFKVLYSFVYQDVKGNREFRNLKYRWYCLPQAVIYYSPDDTNSNRIFLRFTGLIENSNRDNLFYQFQLGYVTNISDLIKTKKN